MAGTVTMTNVQRGPIGVLTLTCIADAADGSFPATAIPPLSGRILVIETNPGSPAPTTLYDIVLEDADNYDVAQGLLANRSATVTERAVIVYSGSELNPEVAIDDVYSWTITNNSVNSAVIVARIYYEGYLEESKA